MTVLAPPTYWNVKNVVCDVERDDGNERILESYRRINLAATLTWGITQAQLLRVYRLRRILDYMLEETIDRACEYGFFLSEQDCQSFREAAEELCGFDEARSINLEQLYCQDCRPPFPWEKIRNALLPMSKAGLFLPVVKRSCLDRLPRTERALDDFLRVYGTYTIAEMYDTGRPPTFTIKEYAVLKMAKRLEIFARSPNDKACRDDVCVDREDKWCSMGEFGCSLASDPW